MSWKNQQWSGSSMVGYLIFLKTLRTVIIYQNWVFELLRTTGMNAKTWPDNLDLFPITAQHWWRTHIFGVVHSHYFAKFFLEKIGENLLFQCKMSLFIPFGQSKEKRKYQLKPVKLSTPGSLYIRIFKKRLIMSISR